MEFKLPKIRRKDQESILVVGGFLVALSLLPILRDPYYHQENVNFWTWAFREIDEVFTGERE